jgi:glycosyltransferase involved in cell wall biosynthesis
MVSGLNPVIEASEMKQSLLSSAPLVSIIMPAYNAGRFISEAIQSVLAQTYPHWELLVMNDASTDNTEAEVLKFNDARIRYFSIEKLGSPSKVRNVGLGKASGEYIAFLDADDALFPKAMETLLTAFAEHPERTAVYGFAFYMNENGEPINEGITLIPSKEGGYSLPEGYKHTWKNVVLGKVSHLFSTMMMPRTTYERIGQMNEDLLVAEDYEYFVRLFLDNFEGVHSIPHYIYRYRVYGSSITKQRDKYIQVVDSGMRISDWLFQHPALPAYAQRYRSEAATDMYRYYARERLIHNQPDLARAILHKAWLDEKVSRMDWFKLCFPLWLRSLLPTAFNRFLIQLRWQVRYRVSVLIQVFRKGLAPTHVKL